MTAETKADTNKKNKVNSKPDGAKKPEGSKPKSYEFQAEVAKLLNLMVHSVYSEVEVFLRELVSNSADACDKLRYEALKNDSLLKDNQELGILIALNKTDKTITISDNGIGMDQDELIENLGTIARSGTQAFMEALEKKKDDVQLIGQFGVGFYSSFMVADKVDVISRKAGSNEAWHWSSDGSGSFEISKADTDAAPQRGTSIILHIKEGSEEFLEKFRVEHIIKTYSDNIAIPIKLKTIGDIKKDSEEEKNETEDPEVINSARAIWSRSKSEITEAEYEEFYHHVGGVYGNPSKTIHYRAEGRHEYTVLLFIPEQKPFDLFDPQRKGRVKLYVKKVFITDDADLLPGYLRFVRGIIDSEDMPLNISREMLQNNPLVQSIKGAVTKKILSELTKMAAKEEFGEFWKNFGAVIKEGLHEDFERRDQLLELVRFKTTKSDGKLRSLREYIDNMQEGQETIYYITGESEEKIKRSPHLEGYQAKDIEVLLLDDPVDSFWTTSVIGYDSKQFKSVTQGSDELDKIKSKNNDDENKEIKDDPAIATLIAAFKQALEGKVSDVKKSDRLTTSPVCLIAAEGGLDRNLEKILAQHNAGGVEKRLPVMEINPGHEIITKLSKEAQTNATSEKIRDTAFMLLDQAYILDGEQPIDPAEFANRLSNMIMKTIG